MALVSPWAYTTTDASGLTLTVTFTFDNVTFTVLTITGHKDAGCAYSNFYMGVGADGRPDSTATQLAIPQGNALMALALLTGLALTPIRDVLAHPVTPGTVERQQVLSPPPGL